MAENQDSESTVDPDIARLQRKSAEGSKNIVKTIWNDPEVQEMIKTSLIRETIKNSIFFACFIIGLLKLYDVAKTVIGFGLIGDLVMSVILILIGLVYMVKNLSRKSNKS